MTYLILPFNFQMHNIYLHKHIYNHNYIKKFIKYLDFIIPNNWNKYYFNFNFNKN